MDVSFSAWRHSREESLQLKGDSFSFLFDRRYTNRLNRMSRVFFEAYVVATKELAAQEDRFPSLSEIDAKMESGAVYAFKDRLMKNTEFFEEVKISGVSYLVPRALKFIDVTGTYTDLILNFEEGAAVMPTRRKTPSPPESEPLPAEKIIEQGETDTNETKQEAPLTPEKIEPPKEPQTPLVSEAPVSAPVSYPQHIPEAFSEIEEQLATPAVATPAPTVPSEPEPTKVEPAQPSREANFVTATAPKKPDSKYLDSKYAETKKPGFKPQPMMIALAGLVVLLVAGAAIFLAGSPMKPDAPVLVEYSAYLSNSSNDSYLGLDISNPNTMPSEMEMILPQNIDQSISSRGGTVTISHSKNTAVRLNTSSDANVKIYLMGNWTTIPVSLDLATPSGYDSSLVVHGKDYFVTRKNDSLILMFNLTAEGVSFEQSFNRKG
ncbi:MAG: hypothetical protein EHM14_07895 [Methanothrix sp.]|nr:MAG: hypothetical protein EHM14_07895 [Methanothrix sp.]